MEKYVFSGSWTQEMHDMLIKNPVFRPLDILVSQLDRGSIKKCIEWKQDGFCRWLFIDSGAYSIHTQKASVTEDEYIDYLNSIDESIDVCAQLDTIPGKLGQLKKAEDYIHSAEGSWKNFLYMRSKLNSPNKVMPVYHMGEDVQYLQRMLDFKDENGNQLDYIGISPANDASKEDRMRFLGDVYDFIHKSSNPDVKTHVYGFTSLDAMAMFPCYSADSITHRLLAGYGKVLSRNYGIISVTDRPKNMKIKSKMSFLDLCDDHGRKVLEDELASVGFTIDDIKNSVSARVCVNTLNIILLTQDKYAYHPKNRVRSVKLF